MHGCQEDESHTITIDAGAAGACDGMCVSEVGDCISLMVDDRNHSNLIDKLRLNEIGMRTIFSHLIAPKIRIGN